MPDLIPHVATFRLVIHTVDEVEAILAADKIKMVAEPYLDPEDGDELVVTQVTSMTTAVEPAETLNILRRARNALIRTRIKQCFDMAREFDKMIYQLEHRSEGDYALAGYDYSVLMEVMDQILIHGKDPV